MARSEVGREELSVERIAQRVVELLRAEESPRARLIDAATLAIELAVERDWVYAHADELGAIRLGGPNGRLRFDRVIVRERLRDKAAKSKRQLPKGHRGRRAPATSARVKSPQTQRRASGETPARSPKHHHPGGRPE